MLQLSVNVHLKLRASTKDFVHNSSWSIPSFFALGFPDLVTEIQEVVIQF